MLLLLLLQIIRRTTNRAYTHGQGAVPNVAGKWSTLPGQRHTYLKMSPICLVAVSAIIFSAERSLYRPSHPSLIKPTMSAS